MADYAIGDIQGCFEPLMRLLDYIQFNDREDRLWFVGDLVNRGPQSLEVLRFIKNLAVEPRVTLGNHDLYLLGRLFCGNSWNNTDDTLQAVLAADDREELGHWLRKQSVLCHDPGLKVVMCHAGIAPIWNLSQAKSHARELENQLQGDDFQNFLKHMYGNDNVWSSALTGMERLRVITNYFTRMRFCDIQGHLSLASQGTVASAPTGLVPWFAVPERSFIAAEIVFGHWAALEGVCPVPGIHALDTGCVWGKQLTALRLQDKRRFSVKGEMV